MEKGNRQRCPDQCYYTFCYHRTEKNRTAIFFVGQTAGHHRRLGSVEPTDGTAGDGNKHQRPHRQLLGINIGESLLRVELVAFKNEHCYRTHRHEDQNGAKDRIYSADYLINRQECRQEVVGNNDADEDLEVDTGHVLE